MQSVDLLKHALGIARQLGYTIRQDVFDGSGGGACVLRGKKWLYLDLGQTAAEQLGEVVECLQSEPEAGNCKMPPELQNLLKRQPAPTSQPRSSRLPAA